MLGDSMRRRRGRVGSEREGREEEGFSDLLLRFRVPLLIVGTVLLGGGSGYLYATHVAFPTPEDRGGDFLEIPDLRGLHLAETEPLLSERGLRVGAVDSIRHPEAEEGRVLGQSPFPGQLGIPGGEVELTISLGPERRPVPDVTELRADRALTVLRTTGFEVLVDSVEAWVSAGRVVETDPGAGSVVTLPGEVRMMVSRGPPMVTMPNLVGLQEERARMILDSLGLEVGEVESAFRFGFSQGEVLEHFPRADSLVARDGEVRLVIGRRGFFRDWDDDPYHEP
jgi:eukaryotic-like serine/threonine-protein kinase